MICDTLFSKRLFHFDFPDFFLSGDLLLWELHFQNTIIIRCVNITGFHVIYAEASGVRAVAALPADIFVFVLIALFFFVGGGDREQVIFQVYADIGLIETWQLCLEKIAVSLIDYVGLR